MPFGEFSDRSFFFCTVVAMDLTGVNHIGFVVSRAILPELLVNESAITQNKIWHAVLDIKNIYIYFFTWEDCNLLDIFLRSSITSLEKRCKAGKEEVIFGTGPLWMLRLTGVYASLWWFQSRFDSLFSLQVKTTSKYFQSMSMSCLPEG